MKISDLARRSGISAHALRYYEKAGLLQASQRSESNYRIYTEDDLTTARFIKRCKAAGFSLDDIASLIQIKEDKRHHVCAEAKSITSNKIAELNQQILHLQEMVETLSALEKYCCGGDESAEFCSIISALEERPVVKRRVS